MDSSSFEAIASAIANEREVVLDTIKSIKPGYDEAHELEWEHEQKLTEIRQLEDELSGFTDQLNQNRSKIEHNEEIIRKLKKEEEEDKIRIQRLLAITQPVVSDHTFVYAENDPENPFEDCHAQNEKGHSKEKGSKKKYSPHPGSVELCTIEMHQREMSNLTLRYQSLKQLALDSIELLYDDQRQSSAAHEHNTRYLNKINGGLEHRLGAAEGGLAALTAEHLALRRRAAAARARAQAERRRLGDRARRAAEAEEREVLAHEVRRHLREAERERDVRAQTEGLRSQLERMEGLLLQAEVDYETFQRAQTVEIKELRSKIIKCKKGAKKLELQRASTIRTLLQDFAALRATVGGLKARRAAELGPLPPQLRW